MQKLGAGAAIFACLAVCGCVDSPMEARQKYEQSTADYRACLAANQNNDEACKEKRNIMQTALSAIVTTLFAGPMGSNMELSVTPNAARTSAAR